MTNKVKLLRIRVVAEMLGVSMMTLRRWDESGRLPAIHIGKRGDRRYKEDDILKFIAKHEK